jgi:4-amino-4-deoxy-L-arabinose transferase-like glycosyltransferase
MFKNLTAGVMVAQLLFLTFFVGCVFLISQGELTTSYYGVMLFGVIGIVLSAYTMFKSNVVLGLLNIAVIIVAYFQFLFVIR